jgi:tetratricopeptide (TPR) repeat protein
MDNYLDIRNNIRLLYDTKQYIKCIAALTSFLELLEKEDNNNIEVKYNMWFVHKRLSALYCKFKKYSDAMNSAKKAMKYQNNDVEYHLTIWLLALIQETTNKKRAIKLYDKCLFYFCRTKQTNYFMLVSQNKNCLIAKANNNVKLLNFNEDINTFNNTTNIIEFIHNNAYNITLKIIDKLVDLTSYRVAFAIM